MSERTQRWVVDAWLPVLTMAMLVPVYMGLIDIWHGEADAALEWNTVWIGFWGLVVLHTGSLAWTYWRARSKAQ